MSSNYTEASTIYNVYLKLISYSESALNLTDQKLAGGRAISKRVSLPIRLSLEFHKRKFQLVRFELTLLNDPCKSMQKCRRISGGSERGSSNMRVGRPIGESYGELS